MCLIVRKKITYFENLFLQEKIILEPVSNFLFNSIATLVSQIDDCS